MGGRGVKGHTNLSRGEGAGKIVVEGYIGLPVQGVHQGICPGGGDFNQDAVHPHPG